MLKTDWYPGHIKPVRSGVYERQVAQTQYYYYFDTSLGYWKWGGAAEPEMAANDAKGREASPSQDLQWRGVKKCN